MENEKTKSNNIEFSVIILAYNHEQYLEKAITSVINQDTNVRYEVIIGEDCSTDNTKEIVKKYFDLYPHIIVPIYHDHNLGATKNLYYLMSKARGKYLAFLDGDDFWCSKNRITFDTKFLEMHKNLEGICHRCELVDEGGKKIEGINNDNIFNTSNKSAFSFNDFINWKMAGHSSALTIRNVFNIMDCKILYQASDIIGDRTINMLATLNGNIYCDKHIMSCYRYRLSSTRDNFTSEYINHNWRDRDVLYIKRLEDWLLKNRGIVVDINEVKKDRFVASVVVWMKNKNRDNWNVICRIIKYIGHPVRYTYYFCKIYFLKTLYWHVLKKDYKIEL